MDRKKMDYIVQKSASITKFGKQILTTKLRKSNDCHQERKKVAKCQKESTSNDI